MKYVDDGRLYIKAFLLDHSTNINRWGVSPSSLTRNIHSFIGKPLVLTQDFNHPMPPSDYQVTASVPLYGNNDHIPNNVVNVNDIVDHWLAFQESFRIGTIIDITEKAGTYYAIIEVTEDNAKEAFKQNELPLFVSPAIAQLDPHEPANFINNWTGIHLAIVSDPAYTIHKALITGKCGGDSERCLLQLRQASVQKYPDGNGCSFCRKKALDNYINIVNQDFDTSITGILRWASTYSEFVGDSSHNLKAQTHNKLSTQEQSTSTATVQAPESNTKSEPQTNHNDNKIPTVAEQAYKVANMEKCVQVFAQHGINPEQAQQICQIAMETMTESSQTGNPAGNNQNGPPMSGQFGSVQELEKEHAKQAATIEKLSEELKGYKKNVKTDAERIADLETQVHTFQQEKKLAILDQYLAAHITDQAIRQEKVKKFAAKDLTVEDLREIYEDIPAKAKEAEVTKTASVESPKQTPKGKVQLRTASTDESNQNDTNIKVNKIKDTNSKLVSSFFANSGGN